MQDIEAIEEEDDFSLRKEENKEELESILDELQLELEKDTKTFRAMFKNLPYKIYLKIDSLSYTSSDNKSEELKQMSKKAKIISKAFHNQFK